MEPTQDTQPQNEMSPASTETVNSGAPLPAEPKALDLLKSGWRFAKDRTDLYGWYIAALAVLTLFQTMLEDSLRMGEFTTMGVVSIAGAIAAGIATALLSWTVIYAVSQPDVRQVSFDAAFKWAQQHFFGLFWTTLLAGALIVIGFALLVIPGIILSVYLYFSLYAYATGTEAGVAALKQSYATVKGRWWQAALKLLALGFFIFLLYIPITIIAAILFVAVPENLVGDIIINVLSGAVIGGLVGVISMYALAQYYKYLRATR